MPPKGKGRRTARGRSKSGALSDNEEELPPPPPPRPFKEIEGLPLSTDEPSYSILNNALSIKDTAVLYSSLMRSRKSYTNGNIFDLYWAKGKTKFDNDVNARDRMNKFCDCSMNLGPHAFDVRFFILKDEEIEKRRQDEKDKKKEKRLASKKMREEKQRLKELKNKAKQEGQDPNGIVNSNPAPPNGAPVAPQVPAAEPGQAASTDHIPKESTKDNVTNAGDSKIEEDQEDEDDSDDNDSESNEEQSREASAVPESKENTAVGATPEADPKPSTSNEETNAATNSQQRADDTEKPGTPSGGTPAIPLKVPEPSQDRPLPPLQVQSQSQDSSSTSQAPQVQQPQPSQPPLQPQTQQPAPPPPPSQQSQNDMMQTPESQMMIANLNLIADRKSVV